MSLTCGYVEVIGGIMKWKRRVTILDLLAIGRFTRKNVLAWLNYTTDPLIIGALPIEDFHAVHGKKEIPWATEDGKSIWESTTAKSERA